MLLAHHKIKLDTMKTSSIAALCLVASLSVVTNAFVVQPRSAVSVKPAQPLLRVVSKRLHHVGQAFKITALKAADVTVAGDPYDPESSEISTNDEPIGSFKRILKLTTLFMLWYVLNVGYNIGNKRVLNALLIP